MSDRIRVYRAEGVVLRRRNLGEADTVFTVFSRERGKFEAVARGIRKPRSRMRGHLEPLCRSRLLLARGRNLDVFTQAETIAPYRTVREDLERMAAALYCAELVDRFTADHAEQPELFDLLVAVLESLDCGGPLSVVRSFEVQLLAMTGYALQLAVCASCGQHLLEEETLLAPAAGGFVCRSCRAEAGGGRMVTVRAAKVLRYAAVATLDHFAAVRIDPELARELQADLHEVIRYVLEREPLVRRYVDEIERLPRPGAVTTGAEPLPAP